MNKFEVTCKTCGKHAKGTPFFLQDGRLNGQYRIDLSEMYCEDEGDALHTDTPEFVMSVTF